MADAPLPDAPEPQAADAAPKAPTRRPIFLPLVAGGAIAAALGFGAAQLWPLIQPGNAALEGEIAALKTEVARLSSEAEAARALADRLAALESSRPDLSPLDTRLKALEDSIAQLRANPPDSSALAALQAQVDLLKQGGVPAATLADIQSAFDAKLAEAEAKLADVGAEAEAIAATATQRAALLQLQAALDSGAPYAGTLSALTALEIPPVLAQHDAAGLPTLQSLRASFPDAARAALDAALRANMGGSWAERVSNFLKTQTGARSLTPREGNDPDAILSRAEAALAEGDLAAALTEVAALPAEAQSAMAKWTASAQLRQDAILAVQSLSAAAGL